MPDPRAIAGEINRTMLENFKVIYEDNHLIAVNKPTGVLVQGDETGDPSLADYTKQYIKMRYGKPGDVFLGVIHRIDRPVTGTVIFARTSKGLSRMNELFRKREIKKVYWAIVTEETPQLEDRLEHLILKDETRNKVKVFDRPSNRSKGAKPAVLNYKLISRIANYRLLEIELETGRPHQIRAQLAHIGCPIMGDLKYGYPRPGRDGMIYLHARRLEFVHPVKKEPIVIESEIPQPEQFWEHFL